MNKCNNCGAEIIDSTFCFQCGEKVDVSNDTNFCQKCSAENNIMNEFCSNCGSNLNSSKSESDKKRDEIVERYDKLAEEFGIGDEDYFLTSVVRFNKLEKDNSKISTVLDGVSKLNSLKNHASKLSSVVNIESDLLTNHVYNKVLNHDLIGNQIANFKGNKTHYDLIGNQIANSKGNKITIDGFFIIKDKKFVFMEIDNRDFKKTNTGMNNVYLDRTLYFDNIVSMRVTKSLDDESKFEDITKRVWTSSHDIKKSIKNEIQHFKAMKFKDLIANNDSKDMFDRLLIKLVDNTSYEIRLPSYEFGQKLVDLFEVSKNQVANVIIENQNSQQSKTQLLKEYQKLLKNEIITPEEFKKLKNELIFLNK